MIEYYEMKWYKIVYVSVGGSPFAYKHSVEMRAANAHQAVQWFITKTEGACKDKFVLEVYEKNLFRGEKRWRKVIDEKI